MLKTLGLGSVDELFTSIPEKLHLKRGLEVGAPMPEAETLEYFREMGNASRVFAPRRNFAGGGAYNHFVPPVVKELAHRNEFYTSYTPYQPEVAQGMLQSIYEYQSFVCLLTGMEVSNASSYDGANALADALTMAANITGKPRALLPSFLSPQYREVVETRNASHQLTLVDLPATARGSIDVDAVVRELEAGQVAALALQVPDFLGFIEPSLYELVATAHERDALVVFAIYPFVVGVMKSPGELGADIVAGEGQPLGLPVSFGGPTVGLLATREKHIRHLPGRIVGRTNDAEGRTGFVLTLQAREQHIRRERATSNICTNQALAALQATIYLTALGRDGFHRVARKCEENAHYACAKLCEIHGVKPLFADRVYFNEFSLKLPGAEAVDGVYAKLIEKGWLPGIKLGDFFPQFADGLSLAFTEIHTAADIDALAADFKEALR